MSLNEFESILLSFSSLKKKYITEYFRLKENNKITHFTFKAEDRVGDIYRNLFFREVFEKGLGFNKDIYFTSEQAEKDFNNRAKLDDF